MAGAVDHHPPTPDGMVRVRVELDGETRDHFVDISGVKDDLSQTRYSDAVAAQLAAAGVAFDDWWFA